MSSEHVHRTSKHNPQRYFPYDIFFLNVSTCIGLHLNIFRFYLSVLVKLYTHIYIQNCISTVYTISILCTDHDTVVSYPCPLWWIKDNRGICITCRVSKKSLEARVLSQIKLLVTYLHLVIQCVQECVILKIHNPRLESARS